MIFSAPVSAFTQKIIGKAFWMTRTYTAFQMSRDSLNKRFFLVVLQYLSFQGSTLGLSVSPNTRAVMPRLSRLFHELAFLSITAPTTRFVSFSSPPIWNKVRYWARNSPFLPILYAPPLVLSLWLITCSCSAFRCLRKAASYKLSRLFGLSRRFTRLSFPFGVSFSAGYWLSIFNSLASGFRGFSCYWF